MGVVVGGLVSLELIHPRVAFLAHLACGIAISHVSRKNARDIIKLSVQKKDIRAALALSVNACGNVLPCCNRISNTF